MSRRNKILLGMLIWPLGLYWIFKGVGAGKTASIVIAIVGSIILVGILGAALGSGSGSSGTTKDATPAAENTSPPPSPGPKKASNGDNAADLRNRAQQAVNQAEACLAGLYIASRDTSNVNSMASSLQEARGMCNDARSYLVSNNAHGFSDQNTELFAAADYAKSATNAGLAYLDTQAPSKLADFGQHVRDANDAYKQGLRDLNVRLSELGVAHVKG